MPWFALLLLTCDALVLPLAHKRVPARTMPPELKAPGGRPSANNRKMAQEARTKREVAAAVEATRVAQAAKAKREAAKIETFSLIRRRLDRGEDREAMRALQHAAHEGFLPDESIYRDALAVFVQRGKHSQVLALAALQKAHPVDEPTKGAAAAFVHAAASLQNWQSVLEWWPKVREDHDVGCDDAALQAMLAEGRYDELQSWLSTWLNSPSLAAAADRRVHIILDECAAVANEENPAAAELAEAALRLAMGLGTVDASLIIPGLQACVAASAWPASMRILATEDAAAALEQKGDDEGSRVLTSLLRLKARAHAGAGDPSTAVSVLRDLRRRSEPFLLDDADLTLIMRTTCAAARWRDGRWLARAALNAQLPLSPCYTELALASCGHDGLTNRAFGRRRRALASSILASEERLNLPPTAGKESGSSLPVVDAPLACAAAWAQLQALKPRPSLSSLPKVQVLTTEALREHPSTSPRAQTDAARAYDILRAHIDGSGVASAAMIAHVLVRLAPLESTSKLVCDLFEKLEDATAASGRSDAVIDSLASELNDGSALGVVQLVIEHYERLGDWARAIHLSTLSPAVLRVSAASCESSVLASSNVTDWMHRAEALDLQEQCALAAEWTATLKDGDVERAALRMTYPILRDVVESCPGGDVADAAYAVSMRACADGSKPAKNLSPSDYKRALAQWLAKTLRTGSTLPPSVALFVAFCRIGEQELRGASELLASWRDHDGDGFEATTQLRAAVSQLMLSRAALQSLDPARLATMNRDDEMLGLDAGLTVNVTTLSPEVLLVLLSGLSTARRRAAAGEEVSEEIARKLFGCSSAVINALSRDPDLAWVKVYFEAFDSDAVIFGCKDDDDAVFGVLSRFGSQVKGIVFGRDERRSQVLETVCAATPEKLRLGIRALSRATADCSGMANAYNELGEDTLNRAMDASMRREILSNEAEASAIDATRKMFWGANSLGWVQRLYGERVLSQLSGISEYGDSLKVEFDEGRAQWDWTQQSLVGVHPVIQAWQFHDALLYKSAESGLSFAPFDTGLSVIEGLSLVMSHGLGSSWKDVMAAVRKREGDLYPVLDCSDSPYATRLWDLELTLAVLIDEYETAHGFAPARSKTGRGGRAPSRKRGSQGGGFAANRKSGKAADDAGSSAKQELSSFTRTAGPMRDMLDLVGLREGIANVNQLQLARRTRVSIHGAMIMFTTPEKIAMQMPQKAKLKSKMSALSKADGQMDEDLRVAQVEAAGIDPRVTTLSAACIALLLADDHRANV